ncbi:TatD family hydrolase [Clostridium butyricum]|uniref:TatD family hydrolase n=1 Tax=Clostridium butyricum TaxID=1492 RepID=UPI0012B9ED94|nr:TatD family hydrolase [Clostridium butyricum]
MSKLIDTHFHLDHYRNHPDVFKTINKMEQYTLCVTNSPGVFLSCKNMYPETKYIKFALGAHPCEINKTSIIKEFEYCIEKSKYIGEIGLDFSKKYEETKALQIEVFNEIIKLGVKYNKLMSIHSKKSEDKLIEILQKYKPNRCIIHWFNGSKDQFNELIKLGCYFSVNYNMIGEFGNSDYLKNIPKNKILIESDGPYAKVKGKKFKPEMLKEIYYEVGNRLDIQNLDKVVFNNFKEILTL